MHYFFLTWKFKILFLAACSAFPAAALTVSDFAAVYFASLSAGYFSLYCSRLGVLDTIKLNMQELVKGVYPAYFNKISFLLDINAQAKFYETLSFLFLFYCAISAVAYIAGGGFSTLRGAAKRVIFVSAVFLAAGLFAPLLAIRASGEIPVIGGTSILKFQSKGIIETISRLFDGGYMLPALLILLFSVIVPALKIILCYLAVNSNGGGQRYKAALKAIGKWSMADVFTASIILAYLAFGADKFTDAWLLSGFYFFCGYCLISLAVAQIATLEAAGGAADSEK
jgi:hypothetical protein